MRLAADPSELRQALGCFATGVAVVTTVGPDHEPVGMTVNSFTSVSLDPPLVSFNIDCRARSLDTFKSAAWFAVHVLNETQTALSVHFSRASPDKWHGIAFETGRGGCPIFRECLAIFECESQFSCDGGDHVIFIVRIGRMRFDPRGRPLLFYRGQYATMQRPADHVCRSPEMSDRDLAFGSLR